MTDDFISFEQFLSIDQAIEQVRDSLNIPRELQLTGGSGQGWSTYSTFQRCPRAYYFQVVQPKPKFSSPEALEVGGLLHTFMALYYYPQAPFNTQLPEALFKSLAQIDVNPKSLSEGWRLFQAYVDHYGDNDYLTPIAVERHAQDPKSKNTCRYDLIARIDNPPALGFAEGLYIIEHKTSSQFSENVLDGWSIDGEILGEMALWKVAKLEKVYGPLAGLCVNLIGKQKIPKFERVFINPQQIQTDQHLIDLKHWKKRIEAHKKSGEWPRALAGCISKFGKCEFYNHCRVNPGLGE